MGKIRQLCYSRQSNSVGFKVTSGVAVSQNLQTDYGKMYASLKFDIDKLEEYPEVVIEYQKLDEEMVLSAIRWQTDENGRKVPFVHSLIVDELLLKEYLCNTTRLKEFLSINQFYDRHPVERNASTGKIAVVQELPLVESQLTTKDYRFQLDDIKKKYGLDTESKFYFFMERVYSHLISGATLFFKSPYGIDESNSVIKELMYLIYSYLPYELRMDISFASATLPGMMPSHFQILNNLESVSQKDIYDFEYEYQQKEKLGDMPYPFMEYIINLKDEEKLSQIYGKISDFIRQCGNGFKKCSQEQKVQLVQLAFFKEKIAEGCKFESSIAKLAFLNGFIFEKNNMSCIENRIILDDALAIVLQKIVYSDVTINSRVLNNLKNYFAVTESDEYKDAYYELIASTEPRYMKKILNELLDEKPSENKKMREESENTILTMLQRLDRIEDISEEQEKLFKYDRAFLIGEDDVHNNLRAEFTKYLCNLESTDINSWTDKIMQKWDTFKENDSERKRYAEGYLFILLQKAVREQVIFSRKIENSFIDNFENFLDNEENSVKKEYKNYLLEVALKNSTEKVKYLIILEKKQGELLNQICEVLQDENPELIDDYYASSKVKQIPPNYRAIKSFLEKDVQVLRIRNRTEKEIAEQILNLLEHEMNIGKVSERAQKCREYIESWKNEEKYFSQCISNDYISKGKIKFWKSFRIDESFQFSEKEYEGLWEANSNVAKQLVEVIKNKVALMSGNRKQQEEALFCIFEFIFKGKIGNNPKQQEIFVKKLREELESVNIKSDNFKWEFAILDSYNFSKRKINKEKLFNCFSEKKVSRELIEKCIICRYIPSVKNVMDDYIELYNHNYIKEELISIVSTIIAIVVTIFFTRSVREIVMGSVNNTGGKFILLLLIAILPVIILLIGSMALVIHIRKFKNINGQFNTMMSIALNYVGSTISMLTLLAFEGIVGYVLAAGIIILLFISNIMVICAIRE